MKTFPQPLAPQVLLIAVTEFVLAGGSVYLAFFVLQIFRHTGPEARPEPLHLTLFAVLVVLGIGAMGLYSAQQRYRIEGVLARVIMGIGLAATGFAVLIFLLGPEASRALWLSAFMLSVGLVGAVRTTFYQYMDNDVFRRRVLVYGAGQRASRILELRRRSDQRNFRVVAFVPAAGDTHVIADDRVACDGVKSLFDYAGAHGVNEIVIAADDRRREFPVGDLLRCKLSGIRIIDLMEFLERETGRVKVDMVHPSWLIFQEGFRLDRNEFAFRTLDLLAVAVLLPVAVPLMALSALAIWLDDGRPILYRQQRVGRNGRTFTLYKFRSMKDNAESEGNAVWADREDQRVTRVGKYLRMCRADELPQLVNVLKNDMSFVGPRPERPEFVEELTCKIPYYQERHCVKPGLTGWAQLSYPYGASEKDALAKLEFDMYYIKNRSMIFNLVILLQTAEVVLWQKGAR